MTSIYIADFPRMLGTICKTVKSKPSSVNVYFRYVDRDPEATSLRHILNHPLLPTQRRYVEIGPEPLHLTKQHIHVLIEHDCEASSQTPPFRNVS